MTEWRKCIKNPQKTKKKNPPKSQVATFAYPHEILIVGDNIIFKET